ncbi:MAG: tRNA lysidine(34) synthetase TilS [Clostridia bacterium]|nr:tRNA lysidine(34) synthetase TilS [Clostridia bacterium]
MKLKFEGLIEKGDRVAVAVSGGKDSVALFYALCEAEKRLGIEVCALNVEHGIRGAASVNDSLFVKKICDNARKRLFFYQVDVPSFAAETGMSIETAAREMRYSCFLRAVEEGLCDKVATAHHAGDNAESVLLNLFRGSGLKGLCGIPEKSYGGKIIRPMLGVGREEIDRYVSENDLPFVNDESNFNDGYSRNFLRNRVIPVIKERYPEFEQSVLRCSAICAETDEYIEKCAKKAVKLKNGVAEITLSEDLVPPVSSAAAIYAMKAAGLEKDYEASHVDAILSLYGKQAGSGVDLPHGYRAEKRYGNGIIIYKDTEAEKFDFPFKNGRYNLSNGVLVIEKTALPNIGENEIAAFFAEERKRGILYVNADLPEGARIRTRMEGDVFRKFGSGSRPLKEYFIDEKTDRRKRDTIPVAAFGNEILFVAGMEISALAAVPLGAAQAYKITYESKN